VRVVFDCRSVFPGMGGIGRASACLAKELPAALPPARPRDRAWRSPVNGPQPSLPHRLAGSRKFLVLVAGLALLAAVQIADLDPAQATELSEKATALLVAYLVGQGVADHGKEAARLRADSQTHSSTTRNTGTTET